MKNLNAVVSTPRQTTLKSLQLKDILAIATLAGQCDRQKRLRIAIRRRELTLGLEIFEQSGITGELAIFALATIQSLGVVV